MFGHFFCLLHFYILKNYISNKDSFVLKENSVAKKVLIYIILIFSILFAISNEIINLLFILIYLCVILYYKYKKKQIPICAYIFFVISILGMAYILLSPGNSNRYEKEIMTWFPEYKSVSLLNKASFGLTNLLNNLLTRFDISTFLFFSILAFTPILKKNKVKTVLIASIPVIIISLLFLISLFKPSYTNFIFHGANHFGFFENNLKTLLICGIFYLLIVISVLFGVYNIYKSSQRKFSLILLLLLFLILISVSVMGFSPTVWASADRWFIIPNFLLAIINFLMLSKLLVVRKVKNYR
ncbi:MAG: DUF6056 family protein [Methanobrevibacter sp.]|jgi:hypothetical protein|nr:DUF6056 family protein [Candidatus Methanovirga procula]